MPSTVAIVAIDDGFELLECCAAGDDAVFTLS